MEEGFVKVVSPIEDTPAFRAGLKPGDFIIRIDDASVKGMSLNDAVKRMRGKPKTTIRLTIMRKGEAKPFEVTLTRDVIRVQSVKSRLIEPGYGWVRVSQFQEHTGENLVKHLEGLYRNGPLKGLILDLRNDPGGLLNGAVGISATFLLPRAAVVSTDGRTEDAKRKFIAAPEDYLRGSRDDYLKNLPAAVKTVPMVVLVNGGSASASEIVAGALQDHKRATLIGTQTFGKGSVQTILPLGNNTAIKLTTARYYTPNGRSIQAKGITPDILVEDPTSPTTGRLREADLEKHLLNEQDPNAQPEKMQQTSTKPGTEAEEKPPAPLEFASDKDFQFLQAMNFLKGLPVAQVQQSAQAPVERPKN
jgi:carboxyl-terminal processing protease